ncbi:intracellular proteinase inhibitor [Gracilibacillus boraciitolerans JCM 21714]|uniref:Intracellular proteinase inhibitor n=1 Tax=Gracilibacillus boraciitolerans JCM 21714 TaxID=1298598 RepID=W4VKD2_9BACI|nr:BsuPI-related putative proteinase inhibitor [Gracilibacillus boraciitolerans]GAE93606.1 intracellular proteinase inhibitor [Gracilibacillus boraciitolerans JCM 21714]
MMFKILASLSIFTFILLAGCGTAASEDKENSSAADSENKKVPIDLEKSEKSPTEDLDEIIQNLGLSVDVEQRDNSIDFTFSLNNKNKQAIDMLFSSGQQYEIELYQNESLIYKFSEGKMFTEALVEESLAVGETKKWSETWEVTETIDPGKYQATMTLLPVEINGQKLDGTPFQQTIELALEKKD